MTYNKDDLKKAADAAEAAVRKGNAGNATPLHTIKKSQSAAVKVSPSVAAAAGFTSPSPQGVVRTNTAMFQGAGAGLSASMQFSCFEKSQNRPTCGIIERYLSKQLCGNPMYCQTLESVKDPSKVAAHKNKYLHVCKYGQSCRDINIPAHKRDFVHLDKPPCLDNNCKNTDPIHRSDYHHQGCWDYLIPCLHNGCNDTTYQHCCKYQHGATPYYPLLKKY